MSIVYLRAMREAQRIGSRKKTEINENQRNHFLPRRDLNRLSCAEEGPDRFFEIWDFPYLKLGIRDFKAKSGRDLELKLYAGGLLPKITLGIARSFGSGLRD